MPDTTVEEIGQEVTLAEVQSELSAVKSNYAMLEENMADVLLALDNVGWEVVGEEIDTQEIPLDTIRKKSKTTRALLALNPIIKRGMAVRTAYIWGGGVEFVGLDAKGKFFKKATNQKYLLSPQAWGEMEAALGTDGNFFMLVDKGGIYKANADRAKLTRLPMEQIQGTVSDPENQEDIWFYRREWTTIVNSTSDESERKIEHIAYYPAIDYDVSNGRPSMIRGKQVVWTAAIAHNTVNKQLHWRWGVGDVTAVIFWAGAHKKFLEMSAQLVQAYSRFAFKATQPSRAGVNATATKVASQPSYNPQTGQYNEVGGTAVLGAGANLQAIGRTGGSVDFKAGTPLAGYVAAGLEVPLTELMADASDTNRSSAETLNGSTMKAMKTRQELHKRFFEQIFTYLGMEDVTLKFPPIESEPIHLLIQAIANALPLNALFPQEIRKMLLKAFDLDGTDKLPTEEELGLLLASNLQASKDAAKVAADAAKNPVAPPAPGVPGNAKVKKAPSNAPSYGDNTKRSAVGQHKYSAGKNG